MANTCGQIDCLPTRERQPYQKIKKLKTSSTRNEISFDTTMQTFIASKDHRMDIL